MSAWGIEPEKRVMMLCETPTLTRGRTMKLLNVPGLEPYIIDPRTGDVIDPRTGEVVTEHIPAEVLGVQPTSPARDQKRIEDLEERISSLESVSRKKNYRKYKRMLRLLAGSRRKPWLLYQDLLIKVKRGELTTWQVANMLNVSPKTVYNWVKHI